MYNIKFLDGSRKSFETLVEADLRWADLYKADLRGADLYKADLQEANLRGADLENTCVKGFTLGKHFGFYHEGYVKIGCEGHTLDYWLENYREIGKKAKYNEHEIECYGSFFKFLSKL